jgi:hypothetical protein
MACSAPSFCFSARQAALAKSMPTKFTESACAKGYNPQRTIRKPKAPEAGNDFRGFFWGAI